MSQIMSSEPGFSELPPRNRGPGPTSERQRQQRRDRLQNIYNPKVAKKELQFHAMLLVPHQIELIFVLCTLLSGRRKISLQRRFSDLGFADVLRGMFDRMSWDAPPFSGSNPIEHLHGPGCECNPESAVRVQFLRLIHNFYDRVKFTLTLYTINS